MSDDINLRSKKNLSSIFRAFQEVGQNSIASRLSVSDAAVSTWKTKEAEGAARYLAAAGLKVVPVTLKCYEPKQIDAVLALAKARLDQIESAEQLQWEDAE